MPTAIPISTPAPVIIPLIFAAYAAAWWVREAPRLKRSTRDTYADVLFGDLVTIFGDRELAHLTRGVIRAGLDAIEDRGLSPSSVIRARAVLSRILDYAVEREHLHHNPVRDVRPPMAKAVRKLVVPSAAELVRVRAAIQALPIERQMFFELLDGTAMRVGEAQVLRPSDYEDATQRLRIQATIFRGKLAVGETRDDAPKSGNAERRIDVPDSLAVALRGYLAVRREADWMFPGRFGGPITYPPIRRDMLRIARLARVPGMTVHGFRHARISYWVAAGADLEWIRRQAGHANVAFTIRRYGQHVRMRDQAVLRDLPASGGVLGDRAP